MVFIPPIWLAASTLTAAPLQLAIVPLVAEPQKVAPRQLYAVIQEEAETFERIRVPAYDDWLTSDPQVSRSTVRECGADTECVYRVLNRGGYDYGLIVTVNLSLKTPLLTTTFVQVRSMTVLQENAQTYRVESLPVILRDWVRHDLKSIGLRKVGRLHLNVTPPDTAVQADPPLLSYPERTDWWHGVPGIYTVQLSHPNYEDQTHTVVLTPQAPEHLAVQLKPLPEWYESTWFWGVTSGVAVAAGVTTALLIIRPFPAADSPATCFRSRGASCP